MKLKTIVTNLKSIQTSKEDLKAVMFANHRCDFIIQTEYLRVVTLRFSRTTFPNQPTIGKCTFNLVL